MVHNIPQTKPALLNERQVAERLNVALGTVRDWRADDKGPVYIKVGGSVRYRPEDIDAFIASRPSGGGDATQVQAK